MIGLLSIAMIIIGLIGYVCGYMDGKTSVKEGK